MYRTLLLVALLFAIAKPSHAQQTRIDTLAVYILQQSNTTLQNLESCSFTTDVSYDVWSDELGLVKHSTHDEIIMKWPDKMRVSSLGDKGHRGLWYDEDQLSYYSYTNNRYAQTPAPSSIVQTIDTVSKTYNIEFPAGDFFYSTFVQDIVNTGGNLIYLGITELNGKPCFHIAGKDANSSFQFWISDDEYFLPAKMCIIYASEKGSPQYQESYTNWQINPHVPNSAFIFTPPPHATKITLSPGSQAQVK